MEQRRGSSTARGYDGSWQRFRRFFVGVLIQAGIVPACGASLPGGPDTASWSQCVKQGLINGEDLHVDHEPPLTADERARAAAGDRSAIDDRYRVGMLCRDCHDAKTKQQSIRRGESKSFASASA